MFQKGPLENLINQLVLYQKQHDKSCHNKTTITK